MSNAGMEMPEYRCHKKVWALKIAGISDIQSNRDFKLYPVDPDYGNIIVDKAFMDKHQPEAGGYYVVYKDGYKSFSPGEAFEEGYALIDKGAAITGASSVTSGEFSPS
jgi:hypothetical protein